MKNLVVIVFLLTSFATFADNNKYKPDIQAIDNLFDNAVEDQSPYLTDFAFTNNDSITGEKSAWLAFALSLTFYVTGWSGLHRVYLGSGAGVFLAYFCTGGGFGVLQTVDAIVLFLAAVEDDGDLTPYVNNKNLFMW